MRIRLAELQSGPRIEEVIYPSTKGILAPYSILYIPLPRWTEINLLHDLVYRDIDPYTRLSSDAVVIRIHAPEAEALLTNYKVQADLMHRLERRPIWFLDWNNRTHTLSSVLSNNLTLGADDQKYLLAGLRYADLSAISHRRGVLLPSMHSYHYIGPNGVHYSHFLRVGSAFQSIEILDRIMFWLLPYIKSNTVLLLDSGTILSLGLYVTRYLADFTRNSPKVFPVECLCSYDEPEEEVVHRLESLQKHIGFPIHILFVISFTSSARLKRRIVTACTQQGLQIDTVSLFTSMEQEELDENVFCVIDEGFRRYNDNECQMCDDNNSTVKINPITYEIEHTAAVKEEKINMGDATPARQFFDRYTGLGCVSVHRDRSDGKRHHMIHINVELLLKNESFLERLNQTVSHLHDKVDVVLSPTHPVAQALSAKVANNLGVPYINIEESDLNLIKSDVLRNKKILLVDDVVVTGHRLLRYRVNLEQAKLVTPDTELRYLVGLARPSSHSSLQGIKDMLYPRNSLFSVEELFLPDWYGNECPWCWELKQIERAGAAGRGTPLMQERFDHLKNKSQGLQKGLFLPYSGNYIDFRLGPNAIFGPATMNEAETFASVASAMQYLRSQKRLSERHSFPISMVLMPEEWVEGRYYAPIIWGSILRSARPHDIYSITTEDRLRREITEKLNEDDDETIGLRSEFLLAIIQQKLPRIVGPDFVDNILSEAEPGIQSFLGHLLSRLD